MDEEAEREARLAAAIETTGPISPDDQLAAVRRLLAAGLELTATSREQDMVADLTKQLRARG